MSSLPLVHTAPTAVGCDKGETLGIHPYSSLTEHTRQANCSTVNNTIAQSDLPQQLPMKETSTETLEKSGFFCVRWMSFASHLKRAANETQAKGNNNDGADEMLIVACSEETLSAAVSSTVKLNSSWRFFHIERRFVMTASPLLQDVLKKKSDEQHIYIENVSPSTVKRLLHYIKYGFVYGPLNKLEELLEVNKHLKIGAVWPSQYAFACISFERKVSEPISKSIHCPWTNVIRVDNNFVEDFAVLGKNNPFALIAANMSKGRSASKVPGILLKKPDSTALKSQCEKVSGPKPTNGTAIPSTSNLTLNGAIRTPQQQKTTNVSAGIVASESKKIVKSTASVNEKVVSEPKQVTPSASNLVSSVSTCIPEKQKMTDTFPVVPPPSSKDALVNLFPSTDFVGGKKINGLMNTNSESPTPKSITPSCSTIKTPRKMDYLKKIKLSHESRLRCQRRIAYWRDIQVKRLQALMPQQQLKLSIANTLPSPPHIPRVIPQLYPLLPTTSLRQADTERLVAHNYPQESRVHSRKAPTPITYGGSYCRPQPYPSFPTSSGIPIRYTQQFAAQGSPQKSQVCFNQAPTPTRCTGYYYRPPAQHKTTIEPRSSNIQKESPPEIKMCQWCKLTFGSPILLRLHQLYVHTNKDSLFSFPLGSVAAANRAYFDGFQKQQQN